MKRVVFSNTATPVSDDSAEAHARTLLYCDELHTSNHLVVDWIRVMIKEGLFDHKDIVFEYNGQILEADRNGRIEHWPLGFCDHTEKVLERLI